MYKQRRKMPAWGGAYRRKPTPPKKLSTKTAECHNCKRISIPQAIHPYKKTIKFCTFQCARAWLRVHPAKPGRGTKLTTLE